MEQYFAGVKNTVAGKQPHQDPGVNIDEVHQKLDDFKYTVNQIFTQPPKTEKPAEAPKAEGDQQKQEQPDVEMKTEDNQQK